MFKNSILSALILLMTLLTACASTTPDAQPINTPTVEASIDATPTFELVQIRVGIQPYASNLPLYIAQEEGYYSELGLEVELVPIASSLDLLSAIILGEIDVTGSSVSPTHFKAMQETPGFRYVADKSYISAECVYNGWVVSKGLVESGTLNDLNNLKDLTFGLQRAVLTYMYLLDNLLLPTGLANSDIEIVDTPADVSVEALRNNAIDIALLVEPAITRAQSTGAGDLWMGVNEYLPDIQLATLWYGPSLVLDNRDAGNRFMMAYLKAVRQYNEGKTDRNVQLMSEFTHLESEETQAMCWPTLRADGSVNLESMLDLQEWAVENGYLDAVVPVESFWDGGFIEYVAENN